MGGKRDTAEIAIARYLDSEFWIVETNDKATASTLTNQGWASIQNGEYWTFMLPRKAIMIRPRSTVDGFKKRCKKTVAELDNDARLRRLG